LKADSTPPNVSRSGLTAIVSLYFFSMGFTLVTPAMAEFTATFPGRECSLINSLPTLFIGVVGIFLGRAAGRRLPYRELAVTGSALALVGGCLPAILGDFGFILVCRAIFGIGLGLLIPMANVLVNGNFTGGRRLALLGAGSIAMNAGGILFQTVGGLLAENGWQMTFWGHILYAAALVLAFFIPRTETAAPCIHRSPLPGKIPGILVLFFIYGMLQFTLMTNTAALFESRNAGGAAVSGLALSLFTLSGCIGGLIFGVLSRRHPKTVFPLLFGLSVLGLISIAELESRIGMILGLMTFGLGFGMIIPAFIMWAGSVSTPENLPKITAYVTSVLYLGDFVSTFWMDLNTAVFGSSILSNIRALALFCLIAAVAMTVRNPFAGTDGSSGSGLPAGPPSN
jgi:MFS family permease